MSDEVWAGDDYADEDEPKRQRRAPRPFRTLRSRMRPRGNTKLADAPQARERVLKEATGRAEKQPEQWRQELALGNREAAASTLSAKGKTHNAGSGFGLA